MPEDQRRRRHSRVPVRFRVFFTITFPQILPPFLPLLISSFAFNFNNLILVLLLTRGGPDIPGTDHPCRLRLTSSAHSPIA